MYVPFALAVIVLLPPSPHCPRPQSLADIRDPADANLAGGHTAVEDRFGELQAQVVEIQGEHAVYSKMGQDPEAAAALEELAQVQAELAQVEQQMHAGADRSEAQWVRMLVLAADLLQYTKKDLSHPGLKDLLRVGAAQMPCLSFVVLIPRENASLTSSPSSSLACLRSL